MLKSEAVTQRRSGARNCFLEVTNFRQSDGCHEMEEETWFLQNFDFCCTELPESSGRHVLNVRPGWSPTLALPASYKFENVVVGAGGSQLGKQRLCASSSAATELLR